MATFKPVQGCQVYDSLIEYIRTYTDALSLALKTALVIAVRTFTNTHGLVIANVRAAYDGAVRSYFTIFLAQRAAAAGEAAKTSDEATTSTTISRAMLDTVFYKLFPHCYKSFPSLITDTGRKDHLLRQQVTYELFSLDREQLIENPDIIGCTPKQEVVADTSAGTWDAVWAEMAAEKGVHLGSMLAGRPTSVGALEAEEGVKDKIKKTMKEWEQTLRLEAVRQRVLEKK